MVSGASSNIPMVIPEKMSPYTAFTAETLQHHIYSISSTTDVPTPSSSSSTNSETIDSNSTACATGETPNTCNTTACATSVGYYLVSTNAGKHFLKLSPPMVLNDLPDDILQKIALFLLEPKFSLNAYATLFTISSVVRDALLSYPISSDRTTSQISSVLLNWKVELINGIRELQGLYFGLMRFFEEMFCELFDRKTKELDEAMKKAKESGERELEKVLFGAKCGLQRFVRCSTIGVRINDNGVPYVLRYLDITSSWAELLATTDTARLCTEEMKMEIIKKACSDLEEWDPACFDFENWDPENFVIDNVIKCTNYLYREDCPRYLYRCY